MLSRNTDSCLVSESFGKTAVEAGALKLGATNLQEEHFSATPLFSDTNADV